MPTFEMRPKEKVSETEEGTGVDLLPSKNPYSPHGEAENLQSYINGGSLILQGFNNLTTVLTQSQSLSQQAFLSSGQTDSKIYMT